MAASEHLENSAQRVHTIISVSDRKAKLILHTHLQNTAVTPITPYSTIYLQEEQGINRCCLKLPLLLPTDVMRWCSSVSRQLYRSHSGHLTNQSHEKEVTIVF